MTITRTETPSVAKTELMLAIEARHGEFLEVLLPRLYDEHGFIGAARELGISHGSLSIWLRQFGFKIERRAIRRTPA